MISTEEIQIEQHCVMCCKNWCLILAEFLQKPQLNFIIAVSSDLFSPLYIHYFQYVKGWLIAALIVNILCLIENLQCAYS